MTIREQVARRRCLMDCVNECDSADNCTSWKAWREDTGKQINAFMAAAAEDGWRMRPDEATDEMLQGACKKHKVGEPMAPGKATGDEECPRIIGRRRKYRAMLAAAPEFEWDG